MFNFIKLMRDKKQQISAFLGCGDHSGDKLWQVLTLRPQNDHCFCI